MRTEGQTMEGRATSYSRPVEALDYDFNIEALKAEVSRENRALSKALAAKCRLLQLCKAS